MSDEVTPLSEREMEIVQLVATGATNQQIARELVISVNTVKVHLRNIYSKLDVASRTEATMVAVGQGWVKVPGLEDEGAEEKDASAETTAASSPAASPGPEQWLRGSLVRRLGLVAAIVAILLVLAILLLPQMLPGGVGAPGTVSSGEVVTQSVPPTVSPRPTDSRWRSRAPMPTRRAGLAVAAYDNLIYVIGGMEENGVTGRVAVYDSQADVWTERSPKPTAVGLVSAAVVGGKIYVPGGIGDGQQYQDVLEVYDPIQDTWETRTPLPEPLAAYGLAVLDEQIYLFGGQGAQGYVSSAYRYDPNADDWEAIKPMGQARGHLGAAPLGDRVYVVGGYDDETEFDLCETYVPVTDTWTTCPSLQLARGGLALVPVRDKLYAIGGGMTGSLAFNESYDPRTDTWNPVETPMTGQWQQLGAAFVSPYIYAIGGQGERKLDANEAYKALYVIFSP